MGIGNWCFGLVAAMAVGTAAEAATYNVAVTMTQNSLDCWPGSSELCGSEPDLGSWSGLTLGRAVYGVLSIIENTVENEAQVSLYLNDGGAVFDYEMRPNQSNTGYWMMSSGYGYDIHWDGEVGGFFYQDDGYPWSRSVRAGMSLGEAPAPVPLPAGAALLPFGLGALAVMRKRRRSA